MNNTSNYFLLLVVLIVVVFLFRFLYKKTRRISDISDLPKDFEGLWLSGRVVWLGDGDGFTFFHVPWYRTPYYKSGEPKLSIRLAGIDAPETAHHRNPAQPFAYEAKEALEDLVLHEDVQLKLLKIDRFGRLLAICFIKGWFSSTNVNKKMIELGLACVYKGSEAVYDDYKDEFFEAESIARRNKIGMWSQKNYVSPMDYKKKLRDKNKSAAMYHYV